MKTKLFLTSCAFALTIGLASLAPSPASAAVKCGELKAAQTEVGVLTQQMLRGDITTAEALNLIERELITITGLDEKDIADVKKTAAALRAANADAATIKKTIDERVSPRFVSAADTCQA